MKKILSTLAIFIALFSFTNTFAQKKSSAYAKFSEEPSRKLVKDQIKQTDFFIEYKSKKEATIYLELVKGDKILGNGVKTVKSKKPKTEKFRINVWGKIIPGSGYSIKLYMFEGPKNTWSTKIGQTVLIEDIKISRLN